MHLGQVGSIDAWFYDLTNIISKLSVGSSDPRITYLAIFFGTDLANVILLGNPEDNHDYRFKDF